MEKNTVEMRSINTRITKELWKFLRLKAFTDEVSITDIVTKCLEKLKKKCESKNSNGNEIDE